MSNPLSKLQAAIQAEQMLNVANEARALLGQDVKLGALWADVAMAALTSGDELAALQCAQKLAEELPQNVDSWLWIASVYSTMGRHPDALRLMEGQMKRFPDHPSIHRRAGRALLDMGQPGTAELCFRKALELDPYDAQSYEGLAQSKTFEPGDADLVRLEEMRLGWPESTTADKRGILSYALAKAYADIGEAEAAGRRVAEGAAFYRDHAPFDTDRHEQSMDQLLSIYDSRFARANSDAGMLDARPVFILAPPAAGASWMAQALGAPEDVVKLERNNGLLWMCASPLGDHMPDDLLKAFMEGGPNVLVEVGRTYLQRLDELVGPARRVIDPSSLIEIAAGAAGLCLPAAKFVHIKRDPRDLAWAIYSRRFRKGRNWSYHPDDIARVLRLHNRLCERWQDLFEDRFITVSYEDLAADPATALKPVCDFVGVDAETVGAEAWLHSETFKTDLVGVHKRAGSRFAAVEAALDRAGLI